MDKYICPHCQKMFNSLAGEFSQALVCPHCNEMITFSDDRIPPGTHLGGFEIIRLLGKGGMGHVYLARQSSMNRLVALKVLAKNKLTQDRQALVHFFREMQLSGKLNHPHIVAAIDAGETAGSCYLAMNYVDGEDLEEEMRRFGKIAEVEALMVAERMVEALSYAWEHHGMLHKDIKPGNIMRNRVGEVFLMDMGIAQLVNERTQREDQVVGSPFYMSPEQGRGDPLDWRSDCYSLGATLYHLIVGVPPFDDQAVTKIIAMHNSEPFPEPAQRHPGTRIHPATVKLLRRMMARKLDDRFASWQEVQVAIAKTKVALDQESAPHSDAPSAKPRQPARKAPGPVPERADERLSPKGKVATGRTAPSTSTKTGDNRMIIISYGLMLLVALMVAVLLVQCRTRQAATQSLQQAEQFLTQNPVNFTDAATRFAEISHNYAGTPAGELAAARFLECQDLAAIYRAELAHFELEIARAKMFCTNKQYELAIPVIEALLTFRDIQKRKEAEMFLVLVKQSIQDRDAKTSGE